MHFCYGEPPTKVEGASREKGKLSVEGYPDTVEQDQDLDS